MKRLLSLAVPPQELQEALEVISRAGGWDGLELPGDSLDDEKLWFDMLEALRLPVLAITGLLPDSVARYLAEADGTSQTQLLGYLKQAMATLASLDIQAFSIDPGMHRIDADSRESGIEARVRMLRALMPLAEALELTVCVPLRMPAADPTSPLAHLATQLVNEVMHPCCRLALDVFPEELEGDFDVNAVLKDYHYNVAVIRFHYEPALGITVTGEMLERWAKALRWQGFRGLFIFCPVFEQPEQLLAENDRLTSLFQEYWLRGSGDDAAAE